jgi:hypothetical protein
MVKHVVLLFQHITRTPGGNFLPEVAVDTAIASFNRNANPLQMYPLLLERHQQQLQQQQSRMMEAATMWPNEIHDPDEITKVVSKDPAAHGDPGSVAFPALRPTLTGGVSLGIQNGMWHCFTLLPSLTVCK